MRTRLLLAPLLLLGPLAACGDDGGGTSDATQIRTTVKAILAAEAASDAKAVVTHFTDDGIEALYGSSRTEVLKPGFDFNEDGPTKLRDLKVAVDGDKAVATTDVQVGHGLQRVPLDMIHKDDAWLVDGVESVDASPAPDGVPNVTVTAVDYKFDLDATKLESGRFRIAFHNEGKETHEMTLVRVPTGTLTAAGMAAIAGVRGDSDELPTGYSVVDHVAFADPGSTGSYLLADHLEPGDYAFVCRLPQGGFDPKTHEPVNPAGAPHVSLGMYAPFTVTG